MSEQIHKFDPTRFKMGYFIQYKTTGDFFGRAIEKDQLKKGFKKEDASYIHVEVSGGDIHSVYARPPRSTMVDITKAHAGRYYRLQKFKLYDEDQTDRNRIKVAYFSASLSNLKYDKLGVLRFIAPFLPSIGSRFFCSEGALWSLYMMYPMALGINPEDCMPAHFGNSEFFETVAEGYIPHNIHAGD